MIPVLITEDTLPGIEVTFVFRLDDEALALVEVRIAAADGACVPSLQALPLGRWEKRARGTAMRRHASAEYGSPEHLVLARYPDLIDATGGNALRRRNSLVRLASVAAEYAAALEGGASNPAEAVGRQRNVSAATVRGWLHRARREGLTPASTHPNAVGSQKGGRV